MPTTYINPFDFRKILVEYFIGTEALFAYAFVLLFSFIAAKFGFSNKIYFFLLIIGSIIFSAFMGQGIYVIILVLFGGFAFKTISRYVA